MSKLTLRQAAAWCGGTVEAAYADVEFLGANIDSRHILPGQLFVALEAERDGHDYIPAAFEKGAAAVLCSRKVGDYPAIYVNDPWTALGDIARQERLRLGMKVVAVTGSVGKSTTKEMIACVLEGDYAVSKTPANHNNTLGMPMAILSMPETTQVAVLEMGMSDFGEIRYLSKIGLPDVALIINIGTMHMEHLGSREGILQAKLEILEGLKPEGQLILNGDDDMLSEFGKTAQRPITYFAQHAQQCQLRAENVREQDGVLSFRVLTGEGSFLLELPLEGMHYVSDALAAVAAGLAMGVSPEHIAQRLRQFRNISGRQEIYEAKGFTIINDCYNAGPESMEAALKVLGNRPGRKIAVLGDMLELGSHSRLAHEQVGRLAAKYADILLCYGKESEAMLEGAKNSIYSMHFEEKIALAEKLRELIQPGDVLLLKGSRGMKMEQILEMFMR